MLADSAVEIEQVKWVTLMTAWKADQGKDVRHQASIAKLSGAQMVWRVADRMLQLHGGMGYTREVPIERVLREVRVYRIFEGTDEIQKRSIARNLLRGHAEIGAWD
jgi:alkylation response protein AidB-like acyl-CoA dehydrogenase